MRRKKPSSFEQDALTGWRKLYVYTQRAGVVKKAKRMSSRRERHQARDEIRRGEEQ